MSKQKNTLSDEFYFSQVKFEKVVPINKAHLKRIKRIEALTKMVDELKTGFAFTLPSKFIYNLRDIIANDFPHAKYKLSLIKESNSVRCSRVA